MGELGYVPGWWVCCYFLIRVRAYWRRCPLCPCTRLLGAGVRVKVKGAGLALCCVLLQGWCLAPVAGLFCHLGLLTHLWVGVGSFGWWCWVDGWGEWGRYWVAGWPSHLAPLGASFGTLVMLVVAFTGPWACSVSVGCGGLLAATGGIGWPFRLPDTI